MKSTPQNNPNHPWVRCVDGVEGGGDGPWINAQESNAKAPFRVFDILHQKHVGPEFPAKWMAKAWLIFLGGERV